MRTIATILCVISVVLHWNSAQVKGHGPQDIPSKIRVTTIMDPPFMMSAFTSKTNRYQGIIPDIMKQIGDRLNCSFEFSHVSDGRYGSLKADGNWTGMIGELQNKDADIAAAPLTITSKRMEAVDFSHPFMDAGVRILIKIPASWNSIQSVFILMAPYRAEVWVIGLLMFVAVSVLFYVIGRYSPSENPRDRDGLDLNNSFFLSFSAFMLQGYHTIPRSVAARVLICFWWMFALFFITAYVANLTAFFLTKEPIKRTLPVLSFNDLAKGRIPFGTVKYGSTSNFFKKSPVKVDQKIGEYLDKHEGNLQESVKDGIDRVRKGNYAFIMEGPAAEYAASQSPCDLMVIGEPKSPSEYGFACVKGSSICDALSIVIQEMKETDVLEDIKRKWYAGDCGSTLDDEYVFHGFPFFSQSDSKDITVETGVTLKRFGAPITFICVGIGISILALVAEIIYTSKTRKLPGHSALREDEQAIQDHV
ncbi:hypothetical protein ScPMuIL_018402 [Solemya velum]